MNSNNENNDLFSSSRRSVGETSENTNPQPNLSNSNRPSSPTSPSTNISQTGGNINLTYTTEPTSSLPSTSVMPSSSVQPVAQASHPSQTISLSINQERVNSNSSRITITITSRAGNPVLTQPEPQQSEQSNRSIHPTPTIQSPQQPVTTSQERNLRTANSPFPTLSLHEQIAERLRQTPRIMNNPSKSKSSTATRDSSQSKTVHQPQKRRCTDFVTYQFPKLSCGPRQGFANGMPSVIDNHRYSESGNVDPSNKLKCPFCNNTFTNRKGLREHIEEFHQQVLEAESDDD